MQPASPSSWLLQLVVKPATPKSSAHTTTNPNAPKSKRAIAYGRAALERERRRLSSAPRHQRNNTLNLGGFQLGQLIGAGILDEAEVVARLKRTATEIGLEPGEIGPTIQSGIEAGKRSPRGISPASAQATAEQTPGSDDDQQLVMRHHRLGAGGAHLGLLSRRSLGGQRRRQRVYRCGCRHEPDYRTVSRP